MGEILVWFFVEAFEGVMKSFVAFGDNVIEILQFFFDVFCVDIIDTFFELFYLFSDEYFYFSETVFDLKQYNIISQIILNISIFSQPCDF